MRTDTIYNPDTIYNLQQLASLYQMIQGAGQKIQGDGQNRYSPDGFQSKMMDLLSKELDRLSAETIQEQAKGELEVAEDMGAQETLELIMGELPAWETETLAASIVGAMDTEPAPATVDSAKVSLYHFKDIEAHLKTMRTKAEDKVYEACVWLSHLADEEALFVGELDDAEKKLRALIVNLGLPIKRAGDAVWRGDAVWQIARVVYDRWHTAGVKPEEWLVLQNRCRVSYEELEANGFELTFDLSDIFNASFGSQAEDE